MPLYVIQQHRARRLHWGALPKEPPREPGVRRLAVEVEDHPLDYANFEGVIPEGQYGAGVVEIWDKGRYEPVKWEPDEIVVDLHGQKLRGRYVLIRFRPDENPKNWLFFKARSDGR